MRDHRREPCEQSREDMKRQLHALSVVGRRFLVQRELRCHSTAAVREDCPSGAAARTALVPALVGDD